MKKFYIYDVTGPDYMKKYKKHPWILRRFAYCLRDTCSDYQVRIYSFHKKDLEELKRITHNPFPVHGRNCW